MLGYAAGQFWAGAIEGAPPVATVSASLTWAHAQALSGIGVSTDPAPADGRFSVYYDINIPQDIDGSGVAEVQVLVSGNVVGSKEYVLIPGTGPGLLTRQLITIQLDPVPASLTLTVALSYPDSGTVPFFPEDGDYTLEWVGGSE